MGERIKNTRQSLLIADVVRERDELQGMSTVRTAQLMRKDDPEMRREQPEEQRDATEKLIESVLKDAYAKESMAILDDLLTQQTEVAGKEQK